MGYNIFMRIQSYVCLVTYIDQLFIGAQVKGNAFKVIAQNLLLMEHLRQSLAFLSFCIKLVFFSHSNVQPLERFLIFFSNVSGFDAESHAKLTA